MNNAEQSTQTSAGSVDPIDRAAEIGRELTFGERQRARDAEQQAYDAALDARAPETGKTTIKAAEVDTAGPLSALLAEGIAQKPEPSSPEPGTRVVAPGEVDVTAPLSDSLKDTIARGGNPSVPSYYVTKPFGGLTERQEVIRGALTAPIDTIEVPAGTSGTDRRVEDTAPNVTVIKPEDVKLDRPISEFTQGAIGNPADVKLDRIIPTGADVSTKFDKHPNQLAHEKQVADQQARDAEQSNADLGVE